MESKYKSRKFQITLLVVVLTVLLAVLKVMDGNVAMIFSAAIASYNIGNAWVASKQ